MPPALLVPPPLGHNLSAFVDLFDSLPLRDGSEGADMEHVLESLAGL